MPQPVLLIDESPESMPPDLVQHLQSMGSVYWRGQEINPPVPSLKLYRANGVWCFDLPDQGGWPEKDPQAFRRIKSRSTNKAIVSFSFSELLGAHRLDAGALHTELVLKAVLGRKGLSRILHNRPDSEDVDGINVVDATAGLGRDALLFAAAGCDVVAVEKNPLIAFLLQEAKASAVNSDRVELKNAVARVNFYSGDSIEYLSHKRDGESRPDVIYIDPMYSNAGASTNASGGEGLKKTAAVKKNAQLLQCVDRIFTSSSGDAASQGDELLDQALRVARQKVVVKRAPKAPWLGERKPSSSLGGKAVRFDIYACHVIDIGF